MEVTKMKKCPNCRGTTDMSCTLCSGSGFDPLDGGQCNECSGSGEIDCLHCEDGYVVVDGEYYDYDEDGLIDTKVYEKNESVGEVDVNFKRLINPVELVEE